MPPALFAGFWVSDLEAAIAWYSALLGAGPVMRPNDDEAVWEIADDRYVYVERAPDRAGHSHATVFLDDLDGFLTAAGVAPASTETYENGVRKVVFRDPDGNEFGVGGAP
jgi:catechol 2,3-dioxygenase-like lactoylglutathione lyase family enzyme